MSAAAWILIVVVLVWLSVSVFIIAWRVDSIHRDLKALAARAASGETPAP